MTQDRFDGKVALVTGGASGIGAATVEAFAAEGASVVIADVNEADGAAFAERLAAAGRPAHFVRADVPSDGDVRAMVEAALDTFGALHCAANVAGGSAGGDRPGLTGHLTEAEHVGD